MWIRLAVWVVLIAYVGWLILNPDVADEVAGAAAETMGLKAPPPPVWTPLQRPVDLPALEADQAGDAAAVLSVLTTLDRGCALTGVQVRVKVAATGLSEARTFGPAPACAAATIWGAGWPAVAAPVELEMALP